MSCTTEGDDEACTCIEEECKKLPPPKKKAPHSQGAIVCVLVACFIRVCSEEKRTWQVVGAVGCLIPAFSLMRFP